MESAKEVAVIGAGSTGVSWAALFAAYGHRVKLHDVRPELARRGQERALAGARFLREKGLVPADQAQRDLHTPAACMGLEETVAQAAIVQECVPDDTTLKRKVFADISRAAPDTTLIATSSSGLSISVIQQDAHLPERTLAAHPYNPPHLIPLVELASGTATSPAIMERAGDFYRGLGREVVTVNGDVPGYIANRLSAALWREAIELVRSGVATVEDVDRAVRFGPGLRWATMGPNLIYHLGGGPGGIRGHMAHLAKTKEGILRDLATWTTFPPETTDLLEKGLQQEIAGRSIEQLESERDGLLAALLSTLRRHSHPSGGAGRP